MLLILLIIMNLNINDPEYNIEVEQPINFTIYNQYENDRFGNSSVVLFGAGQFLDYFNYGSQNGVVITPDYGVSYSQVLYDDLNSPFVIKSIRVQSFLTHITISPGLYYNTAVNNVQLQTTQPISSITNDVYGFIDIGVVNTSDAINPYQNQITIGEIKQEITITPDTYLSFNLLFGVKLIFSCIVKRQVDIKKLKNMRTYYKAPSLGLKPLIIKK